MGYQVNHTGEETVIFDTDSGIKVKVSKGTGTPGTAFCLGTLFQAQSSFVPISTYVFRVVGDTDANAENVKKLAIFYFACLLDTERYIVEISRDSALFPQEAARIFGDRNYE